MTSFIKSGSILPREPSQGEPLATAVTVGPNRMDGGEDAVLPPNLMEKIQTDENWEQVSRPTNGSTGDETSPLSANAAGLPTPHPFWVAANPFGERGRWYTANGYNRRSVARHLSIIGTLTMKARRS